MAPEQHPPGSQAGDTSPTIASLCATVAHRTRADGVDGVSVTQWVAGDITTLIYASDALAEKLVDLQLTLGEGPGPLSREKRTPLLVCDLRADPVSRRWVAFAGEAERMGVRAVLVFPLKIGAVMLGSLTLHGCSPVTLGSHALSEVLRLTHALSLALLVPGATGDSLIDGHDPSAGNGAHAVTHQATGMVKEQLGSTLGEALVRLRSHAYAHDIPLVQVARDVVERRVSFAAGSSQAPGGARHDGACDPAADPPRPGRGDEDDFDSGETDHGQ